MPHFTITLYSSITYDYSNRPLFNIRGGRCSMHRPQFFLWLYSLLYVEPPNYAFQHTISQQCFTLSFADKVLAPPIEFTFPSPLKLFLNSYGVINRKLYSLEHTPL